jgi:hypothetical protein
MLVISTEDGGSIFLRKVGIYLQVHKAIGTTQTTNTDIFTAVKI